MLGLMRPVRFASSFTATALLLLLAACSPEEREFSTDASSSGAGGAGGGAGGSGGGETACAAGETMPCYTGPKGTQDIGLCKGGLQTCLPDQTGFGPCEDEVVPAAENCADPADEDCDATPDCGDAIWSKGAGDPMLQRGSAIAADNDGNVIVVGTFAGTLDFGKDVHTSAGSDDIFVAKLGLDGGTLWSRRFGGPSIDLVTSVAVTPSGDILVSGTFQGTVDFGNGPLVSEGSTDIFLVKLGSGGVTLWSKRFGDAATQTPSVVTVDPAGHVILAGGLYGAANFGLGLLTSAGGTDVFVAKFTPMGMPLWAKHFGDPLSQAASSVATDAIGNIVLGGTNGGVVDFGGGPISTAGSSDIFIAKLDAGGGTHVWSKGFGDPSLQAFFGLGVDPEGNVAFGGRYAGVVDFGGGPLEPAGNENFYVAKLSPAGEPIFSRAFVTDFTKQTGSFAVDGAGNLLMTGYISGTADLGFGPVTSKLPFDMFAMKLDPAGASLWARVFGEDADQAGRAVAADPKGHVLVTGTNEGSIDFGEGPIVSAGSLDVFVAKLAP